jgi:hypothetical protein
LEVSSWLSFLRAERTDARSVKQLQLNRDRLNNRAEGTKTTEAFRNFLNGQAGIGMIRRHGRARHERRFRFFRVLNESRPAVLCNCPQPSGPVAAATTQNNAHDPLPVSFGGGDE